MYAQLEGLGKGHPHTHFQYAMSAVVRAMLKIAGVN